MSQATTWGVPRNSGEADLSEEGWATRADEAFDATLTAHSGSSRPAYATAGTVWLDTSGTPWLVKMYDGAADIVLFEVNATADKVRHRWCKGADIASASALTLGGDGNYFDITGTTAITSIATVGVGMAVLLQFDAALTLTHHATDLILPGGANITTAAGDHAIFVEYATGDWRCVSYTRGGSAPFDLVDEDDMTSNSAVKVPTQQSVKAYVDARDASGDIRLLALRQAADDGDRINMIDGIADTFADTSDIDTGGSTNIDTGTAGVIKPTATVVDGDGGHAEGSAADYSGVYTWFDQSWTIDNSETVTKIWVKSSVAVSFNVKIGLRNSAGNYDIVVSESFSHGGSGWEAKTLSTPYAVPASGTYHAGIYYASGNIAASSGAFARAYKSGDITGSGQSGFNEDSYQGALVRVSYLTTYNNMDARSNAFTADFTPATGRLHVQIGGTDAGTLTLNTDLIGYVSRDNGSNWTAATLAEIGSLTDGTRLFEDDSIDISGQPSGTSMKWRLVSANNIDVDFDGAVLQWS